MTVLLVIFYVLVCIFLVLVVLLQQGKGADLAGAFGGGGSQTALGMRGAATLLQKLTTAAAVSFMLTSLALGIVGRSSSSSPPPSPGPSVPGCWPGWSSTPRPRGPCRCA